MRNIKRVQGFSLLEILIALVILAIGLLGMATLMINSLQTNQSAAMRSTATLAAYDLIERMRSNADEDAARATYKIASLYPAEKLADGAPANCHNLSAMMLAKCDLQTWGKALFESLPGAQVVVQPDGKVTVDGVEQNRLWCIAIFWEDTAGKAVTASDAKACGQNAAIDNKPLAFYEVKILL